jgi:CheY-like chemotaxis protein
MSDDQKQYKVLIVDDVPENISVLMAALSDEYAVIAARNGNKALQLASQQPIPDIILLDVMMPEMDGYEVCRQLKANPTTQDIPVIFISALTDDTNEAQGLAVGAIDYLTKPVSFPLVQARIRNHLALREAHLALERQNYKLVEAAELREDVDRITRHDLKGPLNIVINAPAMLLMDDNLTTEQRETLEQIESAGFHMLDMINRSLDLYKMEVGSYRYRPARIDLVPILHRVINEYQGVMRSHGITTEIQLQGQPLEQGTSFMVRGEEMLCHTMFSNLVKNAVEAAPKTSTITLSMNHLNGQAAVRIHNEGAVPEEIRARFFDKYTTAGKQSGTGLGTYSARLFARTQGGDITLDTSQERGTALTVTLSTEA